MLADLTTPASAWSSCALGDSSDSLECHPSGRHFLRKQPGTLKLETTDIYKVSVHLRLHSTLNHATGAAQYLTEPIRSLMKSLRNQLVNDRRMDALALHSAGLTADYSERDLSEWEDVYDIQGNLLRKGPNRETRKSILTQGLF
eukprot:3893890-Amphidinium_carterae.4